MIMEAMKTMESPADAAGAAAEKRCYTVEDLQIILGVSRAVYISCSGRMNSVGSKSDRRSGFQPEALMNGWTASCETCQGCHYCRRHPNNPDMLLLLFSQVFGPG